MFIEKNEIYLSPLSADDNIDNYFLWINDQENTLFMGSDNLLLSRESLKDYINKQNESSTSMLVGIFLKENKKHIGNITLDNISWKNRNAEIGIILGDKEERRKGYANIALCLIIDHSFNRLNLHKLYAVIVEGNESSIKLFKKEGFLSEGLLKEHFYLNGKYNNCIYMALLSGNISKQQL